MTRSGPLAGIRVVEVDGIGASPFANMLLADLGAEVVRVQRPTSAATDVGIAPGSVLCRGRRAILSVDLKADEGRELVLDLVAAADVMTEAYRPGVAERLGIGPEVARARNPRLIYGRMTGWGRDGPLARTAGHDIDYIAVAGALATFGRRDSPPPPPLSLVGDMGGGGMLLAFGILAALVERQSSGVGQVVDAAMVDGAAILMAAFWEQRSLGRWNDERESNLVDGGAPFYDTYECLDGRFVALGALETPFWEQFVAAMGLDDDLDRLDREQWPRLRMRLREVFLTRTRDEWCALLEGSDGCIAPVLGFAEAATHPHNVARETFVDVDGVVQPAPAPRFSRTPGSARPAPAVGAGTPDALVDWGVDRARLAALIAAGLVS